MDLDFWCKTSKIPQVREMALGDLKVLHKQFLEQLAPAKFLELWELTDNSDSPIPSSPPCKPGESEALKKDDCWMSCRRGERAVESRLESRPWLFFFYSATSEFDFYEPFLLKCHSFPTLSGLVCEVECVQCVLSTYFTLEKSWFFWDALGVDLVTTRLRLLRTTD